MMDTLFLLVIHADSGILEIYTFKSIIIFKMFIEILFYSVHCILSESGKNA